MSAQFHLLPHPNTQSVDNLSTEDHSVSLKSYFRWALSACRQETLRLVADIESYTLRTQSHPEFSPVGWHLGHIAYIQSMWLLANSSETSQLFSATGIPKAARQNLPSLSELLLYLEQIQTEVIRALAVTDIGLHAERWHWVIQHEAQHAEIIAMVLAMHQHQHQPKETAPFNTTAKTTVETKAALPSVLLTDMLFIDAGEFIQGSDSSFATDNERPADTVSLGGYWIDRTPVTCGQYSQFLRSGGYQQRQWWTAQGWRWKQKNQVQKPLYWPSGDVSQAGLANWVHHPVCGVSWYEADAYARFIGKRLPTEAEWAKAASWDVRAGRSRPYPWGNTLTHQCNYSQHIGHTTPVSQFGNYTSPYGCQDMLGNVWEWTHTWFDGYPGFRPFPYPDYSQAYFDGAHRVLRGGSWATPRWVLRNSVRNWYHPHRRELFAGFRCAI